MNSRTEVMAQVDARRRVVGFIMPLVQEPGDSGYADDEVGVAS